MQSLLLPAWVLDFRYVASFRNYSTLEAKFHIILTHCTN